MAIDPSRSSSLWASRLWGGRVSQIHSTHSCWRIWRLSLLTTPLEAADSRRFECRLNRFTFTASLGHRPELEDGSRRNFLLSKLTNQSYHYYSAAWEMIAIEMSSSFHPASFCFRSLQSVLFVRQALLTVRQVRCFLFGVLQFEGLVTLTNIAICYWLMTTNT